MGVPGVLGEGGGVEGAAAEVAASEVAAAAQEAVPEDKEGTAGGGRCHRRSASLESPPTLIEGYIVRKMPIVGYILQNSSSSPTKSARRSMVIRDRSQ